MHDRTVEDHVPTEPTLGLWSLTAFAALLVVVLIIGLFSTKPSRADRVPGAPPPEFATHK